MAVEATPTFSLTPKQIEVRESVLIPFDEGLVYGGARSTKTFLLCYAIAVRAFSAPTSRHLVSRLHHIDVRTSVMLDTWPKMMRLAYPKVPYTQNKSDQFITLPNDSEVWFGGLDDDERVDKILGKEYATVYVNEASQVSYSTILTLMTRLAQNVSKVDGRQLRLKLWCDLNPVGQGHWTHKRFVQGIDPVTGMKIEGGSRGVAVMNPADNPHLPAQTLAAYAALPTRQRQRFYEGKYLSEVPGALWPLDTIEKLRVEAPVALTRIVVAVDPSGSDGTGGDSQGIIAAGVGIDGHAYVTHDRSCRMAPAAWARQSVDLYGETGADVLIAETNFGGAMVEATIRTADPNVNYKQVTASRGKHIRAEPVAALYEQGRVHHVGAFPELEEQMGMMTTAGYQGSGSPDRLDALVWAITELMLPEQGGGAGFMEWALQNAAAVKTAPVIANGVRLTFPSGTTCFDMNDGTHYLPGDGGVFVAKPEHVRVLQGLGCSLS